MTENGTTTGGPARIPCSCRTRAAITASTDSTPPAPARMSGSQAKKKTMSAPV
jgi:hypothetical protein